MSKKHNKFYMIFVKSRMLSPGSPIIDRLWEDGCYTKTCPDLLLFAATTKKSRIRDFFIMHKREFFVIQEMSALEAQECYGCMSTADHFYYSESSFDDISEEREFDTHLTPYWLSYHTIRTAYLKNGVLAMTDVDMCITEDEYDIIINGQSMENEDLADIYANENFINFLVDNVFSKKMVKAMKAIGYKEIQAYARHLHGPAGSPIPENVEYNEYADLLMHYHEVLIGKNVAGKFII